MTDAIKEARELPIKDAIMIALVNKQPYLTVSAVDAHQLLTDLERLREMYNELASKILEMHAALNQKEE